MTTFTLPARPTVGRSLSGRPRLEVGGRPFLVLGAELHNSSGSSVAALTSGMDRAVAMNANTVLVPVSWELVEPVEGSFDFNLLGSAIDLAAQRGLQVVVLWFGSWKNGRSSYVPSWVKQDTERFPRAVLRDGVAIEHLSPFGDAACKSDAAAFGALMAHIAEHDTGFVISMVQVENEVGLLGDSRDRSPLAEYAFASDVPPAVINVLESGAGLTLRSAWESLGRRTSGSWAEVFEDGERTDEAFMAYAYARYVEHVTSVGAQHHDLPYFVNAWLDSEIDAPGYALAGGQRPGTYPIGGPITTVAPIWRAAAPSLTFLAPDIYVGDFNEICGRFASASDGVLFIPEMRGDEAGAGQIAVALGAHAAIGTSPFGIDSGDEHDDAAIADLYRLAAAISSDILEASRSDLTGFHLDATNPEQHVTVGERTFHARFLRAWGGETEQLRAYGVVVRTGENHFLAIGRGFVLEPLAHEARNVGILSVEEWIADGTTLHRGRRLNGDETLAGTAWTHPARGHALPGVLPIAAVGENSGISRCVLYEY